MKKIMFLLLTVAIITSGLIGCKKTVFNGSKKDKSFVVNLRGEPKTFDPGLNTASDGAHITQNVFEGLTSDSPNGIVLAGAESYQVSANGTVYTFQLRQDAKWSDGQPVTAHDYVYAWQRVMSKETAAEFSFIMTPHIKGGQDYYDGNISADELGVSAVDDYTLKVTLNYPIPYFLALTAFYTYYPVRQDAVEAHPDDWFRNPETFIGNGPFKLSEYQTGSHLTIVPNPHYYEVASIKVDQIKLVFIVEATTAFNAYKNGDIQVNEDQIPREEIPNLLATDPNFHNDPRIGTYYYIFNVDHPVLRDVRVRKALSLAVDRKALVEKVLRSGEIAATGFIPGILVDSQGKSFRNGGEEFGIDPDRAKVAEARQLLAEAGYPGGTGFPALKLIYNTDDTHKKVAEAIQEMLKTNLGINLRLLNEEWAVFQDTRHDGKFDLARGGWLGDYADPITMLDLWTSYSGNNDAQWRWNRQPALAPHDQTLNPENKIFDELIAKSMLVSGPKRDALLREADRFLIEEHMIVMPLYYYSYNYLIDSAKLRGIQRTTMGHWIFKRAEVID